MTIYFLVDDDSLVANIAMYPEGMVPDIVKSDWLSTEETDVSKIAAKVYNSSDNTFSEPTGKLVGAEPVSQLP
tara:strand:+ start:827 stop:1045 length:219 start_codon:yes stop_codon:yes gene_type:complete